MKFTATLALALAGFSTLIAAAPAGNYAIPDKTLPPPLVRPDNVDPNTVYYPPPPADAAIHEPVKTLPEPVTRPAGVDPDTTYIPPAKVAAPAKYGTYPGAGENLPSYPNYGTY
jgi:hypothetical protein